MYLIKLYRTFYQHMKRYTFFSIPHGTLTKIGHILRNNEVTINTGKLKQHPLFYQTTIEQSKKSTARETIENIQTFQD